MNNNSHFGTQPNNYNTMHEMLKEENENILKKYFNNNSDIIIADILNINSINKKNSNKDAILSKSPFYNSFIDNRKSFFYLLDKYNYELEQFINYLIKNNLFIILNKNFYNKFLKVNVELKKIDLSIFYPSLFTYEFTSKYLLNILINQGNNYSIKKFLKNIIINQHISLLKEFVERRPFFMKTQLDYNFSNDLLDILEYNVCNKYYDYNQKDNFRKMDYNIFLIFEILLPHIKYNIGSELVGNIIKKNINSITIKYNAVNFFELLNKYEIPIDIDYIDEMDFPVLGDCLKYGNTKTLMFLINHNVKVVQNTNFFPEDDLLDCSFFNYNYKISEMLLDYISLKINIDHTQCITYYTNTEKIENYVKTIFSNYYKKKSSLSSWYFVNNKYKKIYKSSLKKQIDILYNFLNNENNYMDLNKQSKKHYLKIFLNSCVREIIKDDLSLDFLKKYELNLLNINNIIKENNIFKNSKYLDFFLDKIDNNTILYNFVINLSRSCCRCQLDNIMKKLIEEKGIKFNFQKKFFNNEANRSIVAFLENTHKCNGCNNKNNLEFIVKFFKKYYLKNNNFCCDRTLFVNYYLDYIDNFNNNTSYKLDDLYNIYFLNGFRYIDETEDTSKKLNYYNIDYDTFVTRLKTNSIPKLTPIYAMSIINYNIKKFIKKRKKVNLDIFKSCLSNINNEFMFSPNDDNNKINKFIGIEFKKQINKIFVKHPVHIMPEHCINDLHLTHKYITEKVDGCINRQSIKNISNLEFDFVVEYERVGNMNIIFNINNGENVFENMLYLRSMHPYAPKFETFNFNEKTLDKFKKIEKEAYNQYINNVSGKLWWPKFVWILEKQHLIEYLKCLNNLQNLDIFKTDGYILYSNDQSKDIIKIKPFDLLTIDLKYKDGNWFSKENRLFEYNIISDEEKPINTNIYRIYYDKETHKYYSREQRKDKKNANNNMIVNNLVKCHESQWTINDIINNLQLNKYYEVSNNYGTYLKNIIRKYSFKDNNYIHGNVVDLGCGYKQNYLKNKRINSVLGLDIDIGIVLNKNNFKRNCLSYGLYDFTIKDNEQHTKFGGLYKYFENKEISKFDTIVMLNTIHNCFPINHIHLKKNITKFAKKDSIIVLRYLDKELLNNNFNEDFIELNNYGFIKKDNNDFINIYFNWCHNKQKKEYLVGKSDLNKIFNNCEIIYEENKILNNNLTNIEKYFNSFKTIIFKY